uniref:Uncharacterized protein n=1 Tax=Lepeophtheirus salmonis TaxID=72036 RepID=A0A0K2VEV4_LEPSM
MAFIASIAESELSSIFPRNVITKEALGFEVLRSESFLSYTLVMKLNKE